MDYTTNAQQYLTEGLSVIPLKLDGSKQPRVKWGEFQERTASSNQIEEWFKDGASGIGVVTGAVSGNLHVIDFDNDAEQQFGRFWHDAKNRIPGVSSRLMVVATPRPGRQVWFRQENPAPSSQTLAYTAPLPITDVHGQTACNESGEPKLQPRIMIETRGEGGYVAAAGSPVDVHSKKLPYEIIHGGTAQIGTLSEDEVQILIDLCRSYSEFTPEHVQRHPGEKYSGEPRPGDVFNQQADLRQMLLEEGWRIDHGSSEETEYLIRPGKTGSGHSATLGHFRDDDGRPLLYVFSDNAAPFKQRQCYDAFAVLSLIQHGGDYSKAAVAARDLYPEQLAEAQQTYQASVVKNLKSLLDVEVPYKPFPVDCLPETVQAYVHEYSAAIGIDSAFVAVPMLPVLAAAIGGSRSILLKKSWTEPAILWSVTIGHVSSGKTPGWEAATKPLVNIENQLHTVRSTSEKHFEQMLAEYEQAKADGEKGLVKPKPPEHSEQILLNDVTMEALAGIAASNDKLLLSIDELAGWYRMMNQYRPGRDMENWLSAYNGGEININRKKDNSRIWVPRTSISVTGTTQPAVAAAVIYTPQFIGNGLSARLLSARPPSAIVRWTDKEVQPEVDEAMNKLASNLFLLKGEIFDHGTCPISLSCTVEAKQLFIKWMDDAADYAEAMSDELRNAWLKLRPVAARLALILSVTRQMASSPEGKAKQQIDAQSMRAAIELAWWFGYELERNAAGSDLKVLHEHLNWIVSKHPQGVDARTLLTGRRQIATADQATRTLDDLAQRGFGQISGKYFIPSI